MSNAILQGGASGTGNITLLAPNTNTDRTINLPDAAGTLLSTGSPQSGGVIQVVGATYSVNSSTTSNSFTATGLTASITPKFSTSKILILVSQPLHNVNTGSTNNTGLSIRLNRNGSSIFNTISNYGALYWYNNNVVNSGASEIGTLVNFNYLDSPTTTASVTYSTDAAFGSTGRLYFNESTSTMTLLEIAA